MGCGCEITDDARSLMRTNSRPSKWIWPTEHPSRSKDLRVWRRGLQLLSSLGFTLQWGDHLGAWTACPHQLWDWYHVPWARRLYFRMDGGWAEFCACSLRRRWNMPFQCTNITCSVLPCGSQQATIIVDWQGTAICSGSAPDCIPPPISFASINDLIASWGEYSWPLRDAGFPEDLDSFANALREGMVVGCCDGSFMTALLTSLGAAAWKLEDSAMGCSLQGATQTPGPESVVNAHQSELQGIYTILLGTYAVCL
jgi:hypothetical protein